jgi:hypothetical protein
LKSNYGFVMTENNFWKTNQVVAALLGTISAEGKRAQEIELRIRRLLAADRNLGRRARSRDETDQCYAFFGEDPHGTGADIQFTAYEAFALLAAIVLLEHGLPQLVVVKLLRRVRIRLEQAHRENLRKDPSELFDQQKLNASARPGMLAFQSTEPLVLVFVRLTGSSGDEAKNRPVAAICENADEVIAFIKQYEPGTGFSFFDFSRLVHTFNENLARIPPRTRGRRAERTR